MDDFYKCLGQADIVATCLPGYTDTFNVFDEKAFIAHLAKGEAFENIVDISTED